MNYHRENFFYSLYSDKDRMSPILGANCMPIFVTCPSLPRVSLILNFHIMHYIFLLKILYTQIVSLSILSILFSSFQKLWLWNSFALYIRVVLSFSFYLVSLLCSLSLCEQTAIDFSVLKLMKSGFQFGVTGYITLWLFLHTFFTDSLYTFFWGTKLREDFC